MLRAQVFAFLARHVEVVGVDPQQIFLTIEELGLADLVDAGGIDRGCFLVGPVCLSRLSRSVAVCRLGLKWLVSDDHAHFVVRVLVALAGIGANSAARAFRVLSRALQTVEISYF